MTTNEHQDHDEKEPKDKKPHEMEDHPRPVKPHRSSANVPTSGYEKKK